ncbi:MAG: hypothetical protein KBA97_02725 [Methanothrix sp.]|nr:hypothetical protein [Methanothrix sp.]
MSSFADRFPHVELDINGIKTIIVDPHNEIMPYWFMEFLRRKCSLIALRIDAHHDMFHCCPALPALEGRERLPSRPGASGGLWQGQRIGDGRPAQDQSEKPPGREQMDLLGWRGNRPGRRRGQPQDRSPAPAHKPA